MKILYFFEFQEERKDARKRLEVDFLELLDPFQN
jgi:hypothetical protein